MNNKTDKENIVALAQHTMHYTQLLIEQCDSWISEEEGVKNMENRLLELGKRRKKFI
jgi:hypothetical protein